MSADTPFLLAFCRATKSRVTTEGTRGKGRDVVDAFRAATWWHQLSQSGGLRSYALWKTLEPAESCTAANLSKANPNKWRGYERGTHLPSQALVEAVSAEVKWATRLFHHPLWDALRLTQPINPQARTLLDRLCPELAERFDRSRSGLWRPWWQMSDGTHSRLWSMFSLGALATCLIHSRAGAEHGDYETASRFASMAAKKLVPLGSFFPPFALDPLADYLEAYVFPITNRAGLPGILFAGPTMEVRSLAFERRLADVERTPPFETRAHLRCHLASAMLMGEHGSLWSRLLRPACVQVANSRGLGETGSFDELAGERVRVLDLYGLAYSIVTGSAGPVETTRGRHREQREPLLWP
jgi:hypothetical protein